MYTIHSPISSTHPYISPPEEQEELENLPESEGNEIISKAAELKIPLIITPTKILIEESESVRKAYYREKFLRSLTVTGIAAAITAAGIIILKASSGNSLRNAQSSNSSKISSSAWALNVTEGPAQISSTAMMSQYRYSMTPELQAQMELEAAELLRSTSYEEYSSNKEITKSTSEQTNTSASGEVENITVSNSRSKSASTRSSRQVKHNAGNAVISNSSDLQPSAAPSNTEQTAKFIIESIQSAPKQPESADSRLISSDNDDPDNPFSRDSFWHTKLWIYKMKSVIWHRLQGIEIGEFLVSSPDPSTESYLLMISDSDKMVDLFTGEAVDFHQPCPIETSNGRIPYIPPFREIDIHGRVRRPFTALRREIPFYINYKTAAGILLSRREKEQIPPTTRASRAPRTTSATTTTTTPRVDLKKRDLKASEAPPCYNYLTKVEQEEVEKFYESHRDQILIIEKKETFEALQGYLKGGERGEQVLKRMQVFVDGVQDFIKQLGIEANAYLQGIGISGDIILKITEKSMREYPEGEFKIHSDAPGMLRPRRNAESPHDDNYAPNQEIPPASIIELPAAKSGDRQEGEPVTTPHSALSYQSIIMAKKER